MQSKTVLEVIADRLLARSNGDKLEDGYKLCLAVEGGAMRGIISSGMLLALYDLGMMDVFDEYVGISAGSLNLAYVLAGQGALGLSVYFDDMTDKEILNLLRFHSPEHPIFDMVNLYIHTKREKALNVANLKERYGESFKVAVTNVTKNEGELVCLNDTGYQFQEFLAAGAMVPFIAGDPWLIGNDKYYDGGLYYIDPSQCAIELKATHALVLNTMPKDEPLKPWGKLVEHKFKSLDEEYPDAGSHYIDALKQTAIVLSELSYGETELDGVKLYRHALEHSHGVGRLTTDTEKLIEGVKAGYKSIIDTFYEQGRVGIRPTLM